MALKTLKSLSVDGILSWGMTLSQLKNYFNIEVENQRKLLAELEEATSGLRQAEEDLNKVLTLKVQAQQDLVQNISVLDDFAKNKVANEINSLRIENIRLQQQIKQIKQRTENLKKETEKRQDETKKIKKAAGAAKHDKYARVMEALSNRAADLRELWASDDVMEIDDVAVGEGITYEEALEIVESRGRGLVRFEDLPEIDSDL